MSKILYAVGILVVSFAGFVDAAYLTAKYFSGEVPDCVLFSGCDIVTTSSYATIGPVPVALLGLIFYLSVFFSAVAYVSTHNKVFLRAIFFIVFPALLFTAYLVYLQIFVIEAICVYCMFSALTSTLLFFLALFAKKEPSHVDI